MLYTVSWSKTNLSFRHCTWYYRKILIKLYFLFSSYLYDVQILLPNYIINGTTLAKNLAIKYLHLTGNIIFIIFGFVNNHI